MRWLFTVLSWAGIVFLGLVNGLLEDLVFLWLLGPSLPSSWDILGDLFWTFTVPLAQLIALVLTGTPAWFLGLGQPARLFTYWACWTLSRGVLLTLMNNPVGDVLPYLAWIAVWCAWVGGLVWLTRRLSADQAVTP